MRDENPYFLFFVFGFLVVLAGMFIHACTCHCI